jgi:hypothetical protein
MQRPSAVTLLEHEFIKKYATCKNDILKEIIERYEHYKQKHPKQKSGLYAKKYGQKKSKAYIAMYIAKI